MEIQELIAVGVFFLPALFVWLGYPELKTVPRSGLVILAYMMGLLGTVISVFQAGQNVLEYVAYALHAMLLASWVLLNSFRPLTEKP